MEDKLKEALLKRAIGGKTTETVKEYAPDDKNGGEKLVKRKVSTKYNPPDVAAVKALLAYDGRGIEDMTDIELIEERKKLIREIKGEKEETE